MSAVCPLLFPGNPLCCTQPVHPSPISPTLFPHIHPPQRPYFFNFTTPSPSTLLPPTHPPICSHLKQAAAPTPPTTLIPNHPPYFSATHQLSDSATPQQDVCGKRKMRQRLKESPVLLVPQPCRWSKPKLDTKTVHTSLYGGHKGQYMAGTEESTWRAQRTVHGGHKGWCMVDSKESTWQAQRTVQGRHK